MTYDKLEELKKQALNSLNFELAAEYRLQQLTIRPESKNESNDAVEQMSKMYSDSNYAKLVALYFNEPPCGASIDFLT